MADCRQIAVRLPSYSRSLIAKLVEISRRMQGVIGVSRDTVLLFRNHRGCVAYIVASRKSSNTKHPRKPLIELLINTIKKPRDSKDWKRPKCLPMTRNGCPLYKIPLCMKGTCW